MEILQFPGATTAGDAITIPTGAPEIQSVIGAEIERLPVGICNAADHLAVAIQNAMPIDNHLALDIQNALPIDDHTQAQVQASLDTQNHAQIDVVGAIAAGHTLDTQVAVGAPVTNVLGHDATPLLQTAAAANVVIAGCISAHAPAGADIAHAFGAGVVTPHGYTGGADVTHAYGAGVVVAHGAGAHPVVAAVPVKLSQTTYRLSVDTLLGDLVRLIYNEQGSMVHV